MAEIHDLFYVLISEYLRDHPQQTLHSLSQKSKVGYSTMRNVASKKVVPDCDTAMHLAFAILGFEKGCGFLSEAYPDLAPYFKRLQKHHVQDIADQVDPSNFSMTDNFIIILVDGLREKATKLEVVQRLGLRAGSNLQDLIDAEVIKENEQGQLALSAESVYIGGNTAGLNRIRHLCEGFDLGQISRKGSFHSCITAGVSASALEKLHDVYCQFERNVEELLLSKENNGDHIIAMGLVSTFVGGAK